MTTLAAPARSLPLMRQAGAARRGKLVRSALLYGLLLLISAFFIAPLLWMISTSLKAPSEYFTADVRWVPRNPTLQHYQQLLDPSERSGVRLRTGNPFWSSKASPRQPLGFRHHLRRG
jgi:ABC-type glycerol-3-phosphate transport system permease component